MQKLRGLDRNVANILLENGISTRDEAEKVFDQIVKIPKIGKRDYMKIRTWIANKKYGRKKQE